MLFVSLDIFFMKGIDVKKKNFQNISDPIVFWLLWPNHRLGGSMCKYTVYPNKVIWCLPRQKNKMSRYSMCIAVPMVIFLWIANVNSEGFRNVRRCFYPDCIQITVHSDATREVFVSSCNINKVTIIGNSSNVNITGINDGKTEICGKFTSI
jgi:hypothetical protein